MIMHSREKDASFVVVSSRDFSDNNLSQVLYFSVVVLQCMSAGEVIPNVLHKVSVRSA